MSSELDAFQSTPPLAPLGIEIDDIDTSGLVPNLIFPDSAPHLHANEILPTHTSSNFWDFPAVAHPEISGWPNSMLKGSSPPYLWPNSTANGAAAGSSGMMCAVSGPRVTKNLAMRMWEYAHDFGPRIIWPPEDCINCDELDPEGVAPTFRRSMMVLIRGTSSEPGFQDVCDFYLTFLTRLFYDYSLSPDTLVKWITRKFNASKSSELAMLSLAALYKSEYQKSMSAASWRADAKEIYSLAILQLPHDLEDAKLSPWEKLVGLLGIMDFEYHTGQLPKYYSHGTQAASLIKEVVGSNTIDIFKLEGEQMFDVSIWVWCDILDSMATSKPTRVKYESDLERAAQPGTEEYRACQGKGLEWIYGIPNAFVVILARTSALRDAKLPDHEKASQGAELEQLLRNWQVRLLDTKDPRLRVARIGAQEIWRHTGILYVHHAILKTGPNHPIVKDSVKNIIKIAATLEPGLNPDSSLYIPYFIAGFYAISQKDRYMMKSRLLGCGNSLYLRNLARNLDELWHETDSAGRLRSWSERKPPRIAF